MNIFSHVPPGFRFHPTDEELVDYYLRKKIALKRIDLDVIKDVDLYRIEPWDLQELCRIGSEEQNEWYFFSHKDKKYPTGTRTNRATKAGFWKATGRDKGIYTGHSLIGMRKTLVFYKGRAPNGQKSDWIMHEYRLETIENATPQEEGWVVCRVFKKRMPTIQKVGDYGSPCWYDHDHSAFMPAELDTPSGINSHPNYTPSLIHHNQYHPPCKQELLQLQYNHHHVLLHHHDPLIPHLPQNPLTPQEGEYGNTINEHARAVDDDQVTDWQVLDKYVASQLSSDHQNASKETNYSGVAEAVFDQDMNLIDQNESKTPEQFLLTSTSTGQIDLIWK